MKSQHAFAFFALSIGLLAFVPAGCGKSPTLVEVEGTVTAKGKPLENILVQFLPDPTKENSGPHSSEITDKDGRFRLKASSGKDGAVTGWHCIVLEDLNVDRPAQGQSHKHPPRIDGRFNSAASTEVKVEVVAGKKDYEIKAD